MLTAISAIFASFTGTTLASILKKALTVGGVVLILTFILSLIPPVALPSKLFNYIVNSNYIYRTFTTLYFFLPIDTIISCLGIILLIRHADLILSFIMFIYNHFFSSFKE